MIFILNRLLCDSHTAVYKLVTPPRGKTLKRLEEIFRRLADD